MRQRLQDDNRAIYLPAISQTFARTIHLGKLTTSLPFPATDLDFLKPGNPLFHYPYALYSAGQSSGSGTPLPDMVNARDRAETLVLGDSGGYQVSTTPGYFSPAVVLRNLRWMEAIADYSMVLDFPTGGIASGNMREHVERLDANAALTALNATNRLGLDYNACLEQTKLNNDDFLQHKAPGATRFLNVLQGRSERESSFWYEAVKHYPFEGWAFAGHHQNRFSLMLARLLDMRDDGLLQTAQWIHVLGTSTLPIGVLLSVVQRTVRKLYNPDIQFSFDTASAFLSGGRFQRLMTGYAIDPSRWSILYCAPSVYSAVQNRRNLGDFMSLVIRNKDRVTRKVVARTALSKALTLGDLREPGTNELSADGRNLLVHHNVEALIDAHDIAHDTYFDDPRIRDPKLTPKAVHVIAAFIETILAMPTAHAMAMIHQHQDELDQLRPDW
ncbi:hypothetical protein ASE79_14495 [Sphingomonas sp. Leaf28]|nr:hypothetical protein ASE79_14495 [Sphingomonas sp. Leaf28]